MTDTPSSLDDNQQSKWLSAFLGSVQLVMVIGVLVAAIAVNRVLVATSGSEPPPPVPAGPPLVSVIEPQASTEVLRISDTGVVRARTEVTITPQVSGRIVSVNPVFADGGFFVAGQILFNIDDQDYQLRLRQARADFNTARSALSLEEAESESAIREWQLINGATPVPPLVAREPQLAQARAAVEVASAAVNAARLDLSRTAFSFPFSGRVLSTTVVPGLTVAANQPYGTVYSNASIEASVSLDPTDLEKLAPIVGRRATITGTIGVRTLTTPATVVREESALDSRSRLAGVILAFDQEPPFLPGTFIQATISGPELENVLRLPAEAVSATGNVWVVEEATLVKRQPVIISRNNGTVLTERFDTGSGVVIVPPAGAREGMPVTIDGAKDEEELAAQSSLETLQ